MSRTAAIRRWLALTAFAAWVGGFMFYGGAVVPALGDQMDAMASGAITRRVTDLLNRVGIVALAIWWLDVARWPPPTRRLGLGFLAISTLLHAWLLALHSVMDAVLDGSSAIGFHRLHRLYLLTNTAQWAANLGLLAASVVVPQALKPIERNQ